MIDRFQALRDIGTDNEEIRTIEDQIERSQREAQRLREETFKNDYRLGKLGIEIDRIEIEIKQRANDIKKIAKQSKIEWFRNSWMKNSVKNKLDEVRYWCS